MKKMVFSLFIIIFIFSLTACSAKKKNSNNSYGVKDLTKIIINEKEYDIVLEDNETTNSLIKHLPLKITMSELNRNEKYANLDTTLPTNEYNPKHINKGDVMLFGDNCLVIFYKSFDTSFSYTKIGHISDLDDLGSGSIKVILDK